MTESVPIHLVRRIESLRQSAALDLLWLVENCNAVVCAQNLLLVYTDGDTVHAPFDVAKLDERERCNTIIALKKEVHE